MARRLHPVTAPCEGTLQVALVGPVEVAQRRRALQGLARAWSGLTWQAMARAVALRLPWSGLTWQVKARALQVVLLLPVAVVHAMVVAASTLWQLQCVGAAAWWLAAGAAGRLIAGWEQGQGLRLVHGALLRSSCGVALRCWCLAHALQQVAVVRPCWQKVAVQLAALLLA